MKKKISILFVFMLLFQTLTTSFASPTQIIAEGLKDSRIIKNFTLFDEAGKTLDGESLDETTKAHILFDWSVEGTSVEAGSSESVKLSHTFDIQAEQKGELLTKENVAVGQFAASTNGNVTITFNEGIKDQLQAEGSFVVKADYVVEKSEEEADTDEGGTEADAVEEEQTEAEEPVTDEAQEVEKDDEVTKEEEPANEEEEADPAEEAAGDDAGESEKGSDEEAVPSTEEATEEKTTESEQSKEAGPLAAIEENLLTNFQLILNPGTNEEEVIDGSTIDIDLEEMNAVRLIYTFEKPDELDFHEGDTYTIHLPEIFNQTIQTPQNIYVGPENVVIGTYIIENGQLIITFKDEVNDFDNVEMYVNITGEFNKEVFEIEEEVIVEVPFRDETSYRVTIRAEQDEYSGEDVKTAGEPYVLDGEQKVIVSHNPEYVDWTVRANDSMESFENATIIDDLSENLEIVEDSFIVERIIRNYQNEKIGREQVQVTPTITDTGFELNLGDIEDAYDITYTTRIIRPDGGGTHTINNNARIILDGDEKRVSDSFEATWSGDIPALKKSGRISSANADVIDWQVEYNYGQEEIGSDVVLTDTLTDGEVILSTVEVVEVETDIDGNVTRVIGAAQVEPVIEDGNLIIPGLDANGKAYFITFQSTVPIGLNNVEITNTIEDNYNNRDDASVTVNTIPTGNKVGEQKVDADGNPYIEWKIIMNSNQVDVSTISIKDVFSGEHLRFDASDTSLYELYRDDVEVDNYTIENYTHDDGRIGFHLQVTDAGPHEYIFVYRTYYTVAGMNEPSLANDAELIFDGGTGEGVGVEVDFEQIGPKSGISKSGKYVLNESTGLQEIEWTIIFNNSRILLENPVINDTFTSGNYTFIEGSLKMTENGRQFDDYTLSPTSDGFTLNIDKETNARYTITYRTTADDAENKDQVNDVELIWQGGTEKATATVQKRHPGISKSGDVVINEDGTKSVNWTVNFNTKRNVIHDFKLTDTNIPTVQVSDIKITSEGGEDVTSQFTISEVTDGKFTISKDRLDAARYQLTYKTTLSPTEEKDIKNTASITYTGGEDSVTATIPSPRLGVQKQALSIDKESDPNRINWKITANTDTARKFVNLVNPVLTDTIPTDQKLVEGSIQVVRVDNGENLTETLTITEGTNDFRINLPNGPYQYVVTFQTEILEFPSVHPTKIDRYTNSTTLTNDHHDPVSADAYIDYFADGSNNNNTKTGIVNEDTENIDWEATVNPLGLKINNGIIVDELGGRQTYVIDDEHQIVVKHEDGTVFDEDAYDLVVAEDKRSFTISFHSQINEPITVSYSTRLDPELIGNFTVNNEIEMYGGEGRKKISTVTVSTTTSQWTYGGGGSGRTLGFTLKKENINGDPVPNATFDFIRVTPTGAQVPIGTDITTNADGEFEIENARAGRYIVTESNVPEGYERLTDPIYLIIGYGSSADDDYVMKITDSEWNEIESDVAHGSGNIFTVVNEHKPVSTTLEAIKTLEGNKELEAGQFTFELLQDDQVIDSKTNDAEGKIVFDELSYNVPGIYEYEIREVKGDLNGVTYDEQTYNVFVYVTKGEDGILETEISYGNNVPKFINSYQAEPVRVQLEAEKILEGQSLVDGQFEFELVDESGDVVQTTTNNEDGQVIFAEITYDEVGEYTYTIREVKGVQGGITYDDSTYSVAVTVTDDGEGQLSATEEYIDGPAQFTNEYTTTPVSVKFEAEKILEGHHLELGENDFTFEVLDAEGKVVATGTNNSDGSIEFEAIEFAEVGSYEFTIREVTGEDRNINYDETIYHVTVEVSDNREGQLVAEVIYLEDPIFVNEYDPEMVSVGDYVWYDQNHDGLQDETDVPLEGVVLKIVNADGDPVTDVYGNLVEPATTDENGYYIFENLPADQTYTVKIDREASKEVLKGYVPTLHEVGEDNSIDSSTWEATSRHLIEDGDHDPTLDFGFVKAKVSVGDYVWFDANKDGLQDETDVPLEGVVLTIEDEDGNPVTDVYGNPVGPVQTDEKGYYIFENLPIDQTYIVKIDREASKDVLIGYVPTLHEEGDDNSIDSSTWEATSRHLTVDGDHDPTLDFGFVIETIDLTGNKTWNDADNQDGIRPESITVNLLADGEQIQSTEVTAADDWSYSFTDLPKYKDGTEIVYTVTENTVENYTTEIIGHDITNHYTPDETSVTVTKHWDDANNQDGNRPETIEVQLLANGEVYGDSVELTAADNWTYTWTELPLNAEGERIAYTVQELTDITGYQVAVNDEDHGNIIITNSYTPETVEVAGTKRWDDNDNKGNTRPDSITVNILANGKVVESVEVTQADNWQFAFTDLPKYEAGEEIVYTITEDAVEGYLTKINGYDILNTLIPVEVPRDGKTSDDPEKGTKTSPESKPKSPSTDVSARTDGAGDGNKLPRTATDIFNMLAVGLGLLILGIVIAIYRRKRGA